MPDATGSTRDIRVELGERSYSILVESGASSRLGEHLRGRTDAGRAVVVTDDRVDEHHGRVTKQALEAADLETHVVVVPSGESTKSIEELARLYDAMAQARLERDDVVVAIGGGVVGDLAGFAAATFRRGVAVAQVPTTLMAQVDSSIGGKTGVNLPAGKNLVGAFHQPRVVIVDPDLLSTLPVAEYRSGLAEVVKYGIIRDRELFEQLEARVDDVNARDPELLVDVIARCAGIKASVVSADERETLGERLILNLGHTVGHALEAILGYEGLRHGEAVAIGTVCACKVAMAANRLSPDDAKRIHALLEALELPTAMPDVDRARLLEHLAQDKKVRHGRVRFILPEGIGEVSVEELGCDEILDALSLS